jgi:hypothetical protein
MTELRQSIHAPQINNLLLAAGIGGPSHSFDALISRYLAALDRLEPRRKDDVAVIGHGDFCFSNILYEKASNFMRLIDPRGAATTEELWTDPYYDVAKLSHSILGNYDFINNGLYDLTLTESLGPQLTLSFPSPVDAMQQAFQRRVYEAGFEPALVRVYEASLFLSMAPLHIDVPTKVTAFLINASQILDRLESGEA